jgi:hypothetical protein
MQWKGLSAADATWVDLDEFRHAYPYFQLVLELIVWEGGDGRDVMWGLRYERRQAKKKAQQTPGSRDAASTDQN